MIIVRTPLRLPIAGGGTDLKRWYSKYGSMFISATINKFVYTTFHQSEYDNRIRLRYSKMEEVDRIEDIQHDIIRETLKFVGVKGGLELTSHAEIPSGTGLGSSGAFGVGVLHALQEPVKEELAWRATLVQMKLLGHHIGQQDQWASAIGGINIFKVDKTGSVSSKPLNINHESLNNNLVMFYTGIKRDANKVLAQSKDYGLEEIQSLAWDTKRALETGQLDDLGLIFNEHWAAKKKRGGMTDETIDMWYDYAMNNGAIGSKLIGAGGGGFLLCYTKRRDQLIAAMTDDDNDLHVKGLKHQPFSFEFAGTTRL